jgi:ribonuclease R
MRAVLHRDRVRVRVVRYDRKGRPEGRVTTSSSAASAPIIGRLLHENGTWLVAPEDKRYGQDILIPKNATATPRWAGGGGRTDRAAVAVSQPVGRVTEVLGEIDDPGMEIEIAVRKYEVPHRFRPRRWPGRALPDKVRAAGQEAAHRPDRRAAGHHRRRGRARLRRRRVLRAAKVGRGKSKGWRLLVAIADVSHYVKPGEPHRRRRLRARHRCTSRAA